MRKLLLIAVLIFPILAFSQPWLENLPQKKSTESSYNFYEYQEAFYSYWDSYNVDNHGYYIDKDGVKKKASGWKQFKRWEWNMENQIDPTTGNLPTQTAQQVYGEYAKKQAKLGLKSTTTANWISKGPTKLLADMLVLGVFLV
jgi:hypothetical protein